VRGRSAIAAAGILLSAVAIGCGSSDDDSGKAATGGGEVKLMVIADLHAPTLAIPEVVTGAEAAARKINDAGGVNGRKIKVLSCDAQGDPNVAVTCARNAVKENVAAVVGMATLQSNGIQGTLAPAKIPSIGGEALGPMDYTSPNSFPINVGALNIVGEALTLPAHENCRQPGVMTVDFPTSKRGAELIKNYYAKLGKKVKTVTTAQTTTDLGPPVATLLSGGTDCVFVGANPGVALGVVKAVHNSGKNVKVSQTTAIVPATELRKMRDAAQGLYASSPLLLPGTPAGDRFSAAMDAIDPNAPDDEFAEEAYTGVLIFAQAARSLTDFSPANVLKALNSAKDIKVDTIAPIPSFPADSGIPGMPRAFFTSEYLYRFKGDDFRLVSDHALDIKPGLE
jgi:ABC-type branched-subunit amino acid transport system substrate-binding protein